MLRVISLSIGLLTAALAFLVATPSSFETEVAFQEPSSSQPPTLTLAANR